MAFKMKGSPMQRNFGIGESPTKHNTGQGHMHGDPHELAQDYRVTPKEHDGNQRYMDPETISAAPQKSSPAKGWRDWGEAIANVATGGAYGVGKKAVEGNWKEAGKDLLNPLPTLYSDWRRSKSGGKSTRLAPSSSDLRHGILPSDKDNTLLVPRGEDYYHHDPQAGSGEQPDWGQGNLDEQRSLQRRGDWYRPEYTEYLETGEHPDPTHEFEHRG